MVLRLARAVCDDISGNIEPYLEGFNRWLPVIDGPALKARIQDIEARPDEEFSTLLMACTLLSRISRPNLSESDVEGNHRLYMTLIVSHAILFSRGAKSFDILQSKILLAFYEHLQANRAAAVGTLSSAAATAQAMGLFRWHCLAEPGMISLRDEMQRVLCCLYILERSSLKYHIRQVADCGLGLSTPSITRPNQDQSLCPVPGLALIECSSANKGNC